MTSTSLFVIAVIALISGFQVRGSCPSDKNKPWSFDDSFDNGFQVRASCPSDKNKPFSFDDSFDNGPSSWADLFEECANPKLQSPINIEDANVIQVNGATGLNVTNFNKPLKKVMVKNIGYTVQITPTDGVQRSVTFNGSTYPLKRFIIRLGEETEINGYTLTTLGSDHRVNGKQMRAELQLVHGPKGGPETDKLILSVFLEGTFNPDGFLDKILDSDTFGNIKYEGESYTHDIDSDYVKLSYLFKPSVPLYAYKGSLSTPPCTPVSWLIIKQRYIVSVSVLLALTELHSVKKGDPNADKCYIKNNTRGPQPLAKRKVYSYGAKS